MNDAADSPALSPAAASRVPKLRLPATCEPPSDTHPAQQAVWLVFGATGHMGRSLVRAALGHRDLVAAVGWTHENSAEQMRHLSGLHGASCLGLRCDVRARETVAAAVDATVARWGRVDVVAICTGYGVIGAAELQDEAELRAQVETNFFGTLHVLQLTLPLLRRQLRGRYLIFSSTGGALGVPGLAPYCATKYAVEGLIESMLYEIDAFNIKATLVEPGHVRLDEPDDHLQPDDAGEGLRLKRYGHFFVKPAREPYAGPSAPAGHASRTIRWLNDRQPTSAVKSAELVWQLGHCSYPPLRLLLGTYAVESIRDRLRSIIEEIEDWKHLSFPLGAEQQDEPPALQQEGGE
ncbi:uncharacterized protein K452DRAFT_269625 [Aplosporella prunicola CBS 121167]|uniref:Ketoreductase (KR) domain-containing protein n=1 Tax=Aplosporella prunicola CBS 121167 TaxID=1176127 RepID=A0A6A6BG01_9PEZI|nr:uncharacterized protein K452DRAFT_269625 [Aplosporella prunicola CBS 121167]KAF2142986.1 hypothetical protein K452DRAFT_269625 [Aplosporella prunicola CBS 121167]